MSERKASLASENAELNEGALKAFWRVVHIISKHRWLIYAATAVIFAAAALWTYAQPRIYQATATVMIRERPPQVLSKDVGQVVDLSTQFWARKEHMETQKRLIASRQMALLVVRELNLVQRKEFWPALKPDEPVPTRSEEGAAMMLLSLMTPELVPGTKLIRIGVQHEKPHLAQELANTMARVYIRQNLDYKVSATTRAVKWLADQLDGLKTELNDSEHALYAFRKKQNILSMSLEDKQSLLASRISKLNDGLTEIRMKRITQEARLRELRKRWAADPVALAQDKLFTNDSVRSLHMIYMEHRKTYREQAVKYGEKHPVLLAHRAKMETARQDLQRELQNVLAGLTGEGRALRASEYTMAAELEQAKSQAFKLNEHELTYKRLKRDQENTAKLYGVVIQRMKESDLSGKLRVNNLHLLESALVPTAPIKPRVVINLVVGAFLGLLLGVLLAFLVESLDNSIKTREDVEAIAGVVLLGAVPPIAPIGVRRMRPNEQRSDPNFDLVVHKKPKGPAAEACRAIRTNLMFAATDRELRRILVTSAAPRDGKSTTAISLGITMTQSGNRVLLVDTDLRRPRLHKALGVPGTEGLTSVLLGDAELEDVIKTTEVPNLFVLPCGPTPPNPAELCQSERFKKLMDELSSRFDRVIMDSPPVMPVTDAVVLSTIADGCLLVARAGMTSKPAFYGAVRQILDVGGRLLGCALNDYDVRRRAYGYRYYGRYRYGYRQYGYGHNGYGYGERNDDKQPAAS